MADRQTGNPDQQESDIERIRPLGEGGDELDQRKLPLGFLDPGTRYRTLYERLISNTVLAEPDNPQSCWLWVGAVTAGYPRFSYRESGSKQRHPKKKLATRAMLEEVHGISFPLDEAGHLPGCQHSRCINPDHLEVQTKAHNMAQRWGQMSKGEAHSCWIPVLFPVLDPLQLIANELWDAPFCPVADPTVIPF